MRRAYAPGWGLRRGRRAPAAHNPAPLRRASNSRSANSGWSDPARAQPPDTMARPRSRPPASHVASGRTPSSRPASRQSTRRPRTTSASAEAAALPQSCLPGQESPRDGATIPRKCTTWRPMRRVSPSTTMTSEGSDPMRSAGGAVRPNRSDGRPAMAMAAADTTPAGQYDMPGERQTRSAFGCGICGVEVSCRHRLARPGRRAQPRQRGFADAKGRTEPLPAHSQNGWDSRKVRQAVRTSARAAMEPAAAKPFTRPAA